MFSQAIFGCPLWNLAKSDWRYRFSTIPKLYNVLEHSPALYHPILSWGILDFVESSAMPNLQPVIGAFWILQGSSVIPNLQLVMEHSKFCKIQCYTKPVVHNGAFWILQNPVLYQTHSLSWSILHFAGSSAIPLLYSAMVHSGFCEIQCYTRQQLVMGHSGFCGIQCYTRHVASHGAF